MKFVKSNEPTYITAFGYQCPLIYSFQAMEILQSSTIPQTGTTHYVVVKGHKPGIYFSFEEFNKQLKNFSGAIGRKAPSLKEVRTALLLMHNLINGTYLHSRPFFKTFLALGWVSASDFLILAAGRRP